MRFRHLHPHPSYVFSPTTAESQHVPKPILFQTCTSISSATKRHMTVWTEPFRYDERAAAEAASHMALRVTLLGNMAEASQVFEVQDPSDCWRRARLRRHGYLYTTSGPESLHHALFVCGFLERSHSICPFHWQFLNAAQRNRIQSRIAEVQ